MDILVRRDPDRTFVGLRRVVRPQDIGAACMEVLPVACSRVAAAGLEPASPAAMLILEHDLVKGRFDLVPGVFLDAPPPDGLDLESYPVPGGDVAVLVHEGSYEGLGQSWDRLRRRRLEMGLGEGGVCWESYLNDPGSASPEDLRTELCWPDR